MLINPNSGHAHLRAKCQKQTWMSSRAILREPPRSKKSRDATLAYQRCGLGGRYESGRPRAIGIGSSISQEAALLIAAAVVAVGVVVARSPVGIADLASVVKSPAARDVT